MFPYSSFRICVVFVILICLLSIVSGFFSIHYAADEQKNHARVIMPSGIEMKFSNPPSAEQVKMILVID